ncbi:MAG: HAD hydrolase-like protein [Rhodocyclaceae bacterium]|nr:HAD hydrolase-like protein [Rhodocyclaceae bacterium]
MRDLKSYKTLVFDCDGVVLNSNHIKSEAFRTAALPYGREVADQFVEWHRINGGVSRYVKFRYLLDVMVAGEQGPGFEDLLDTYAREVKQGLMTCEIVEGLEELKEATKLARWMIVSGGDQQELREVFEARGIFSYFNGGIFGSPDSKNEIINREITLGSIESPALFFGDSVLDYKSASLNGLDFVFVSDWSEFKDWKKFCTDRSLISVGSLSSIIFGGGLFLR